MESKQKSTMEKSDNILHDRNHISALLKNKFGINILSKDRRRASVEARAAFAYAFYEIGYTLKQIGTAINKDHSTVIHLKRKFEIEASQSEQMVKFYNTISKAVYGRGPAAERKDEMDMLIEENERLKKKIGEIVRTDTRFKEIFDIIKERTPYGAEEELKKRLYWLLNTLIDEKKTVSVR